jgi:hypothetical protein
VPGSTFLKVGFRNAVNMPKEALTNFVIVVFEISMV